MRVDRRSHIWDFRPKAVCAVNLRKKTGGKLFFEIFEKMPASNADGQRVSLIPARVSLGTLARNAGGNTCKR